jgi:phosphatidate cytidylyltransferase
LSNTSVRIVVGLIGIPLVIVLALLGNHIFLAFCVIVSIFCMNEFYNLFEKPRISPTRFTARFGGFSFHKSFFLLISSLIVVCFYFEKFNFVLILYFAMFVFLIIDEVVKTEKHFEAIGSWMLSIVYISTPFGILGLMDSAKFVDMFGINYAIICLVLIWISDTFAFFGGKTFGKHKLAERISPKKTWEGSILGFTFTIIGALIIHVFMMERFSYLHVITLALIVGIFAQVGDLFESHLKRTVNIKDSSQLIPGHGGFLDRFDSLLFSVPALYIYLYLRSIL